MCTSSRGVFSSLTDTAGIRLGDYNAYEQYLPAPVMKRFNEIFIQQPLTIRYNNTKVHRECNSKVVWPPRDHTGCCEECLHQYGLMMGWRGRTPMVVMRIRGIWDEDNSTVQLGYKNLLYFSTVRSYVPYAMERRVELADVRPSLVFAHRRPNSVASAIYSHQRILCSYVCF